MSSIEVACVLHTGTTSKRIFWKKQNKTKKMHTQQTLLLSWRGLFKAKQGLPSFLWEIIVPLVATAPCKAVGNKWPQRHCSVCHCERKEKRAGWGREGGCGRAEPSRPGHPPMTALQAQQEWGLWAPGVSIQPVTGLGSHSPEAKRLSGCPAARPGQAGL